MSECDHAIALDGHEFSLWDQRVECPYCHIAELKQENERMREALRTIRNVSHFDSSCNPQSATCTEIEKQWEALESSEEQDNE